MVDLGAEFEEKLNPLKLKDAVEVKNKTLGSFSSLKSFYENHRDEAASFHALPLVLAIIAGLFLLCLAYILNRKTEIQALEAVFENEQIEQSIMAMIFISLRKVTVYILIPL